MGGATEFEYFSLLVTAVCKTLFCQLYTVAIFLPGSKSRLPGLRKYIRNVPRGPIFTKNKKRPFFVVFVFGALF